MQAFQPTPYKVWVNQHGWSASKAKTRRKIMSKQFKGIIPFPFRNHYDLMVKSGE